MAGKRVDTLKKIRVLAFDVQDTLVDRRSGLGRALAAETGIDDPDLLNTLAAHQAEAEWGLLESLEEFRGYQEILAESVVKAAALCGRILPSAAARRVAATCGDWPFFADAGRALARLARRYSLALVDNAGRDDLARLASRLEVPVRHLVSSDTVAAFKPEPDGWLALLHEMELEEDELLAVSAAPENDLQIAEDLGIAGVYVDRRRQPLPEEIAALFRVRDLEGLVHRLMPARPAKEKTP